MTTPEGKIKNWLKDQLTNQLDGCIIYSPPAGPFGKAGEPDLHIHYGGAVMVIEVKADGGEISPLQLSRLVRYKRCGTLAAKIEGRNQERVDLLVRFMKERAECLKTIIGQQNQA